MQEYIAGFVLILIGITLLLSPEKVYAYTEKWKHNSCVTEPSNTYIFIVKAVGILMCITGIAVSSIL